MRLEPNNTMTCRKAQSLMSLYIKDDPGLTQEQRQAIETHLLTCSACAEEYEEDRQLVAMLRQYWPISRNTRKLLQDGLYEVEKPEDRCTCDRPYRLMTVEEGWEDLKRRCPSLAEDCRRHERKKKLRRLVWRIGAIAAAACILVAIGVGWLTLRNAGSHQLPSGTPVASNPVTPAAFAELVTPQGRKPLALGRLVTTDAQPQEILLGGMHRVVMNRNTIATIAAAPVLGRGDAPGDRKAPYEIQLAQGELYVEVVPGHPFTVRTANARLDITGTKFDVRVEGDKTELTLLKGSVRFSALDRPREALIVAAGCASAIVGRRAPSTPAFVDAVAATAWAGRTALINAVALAGRQMDADLSAISRGSWWQPEPPDVDTLDYATWRDTNLQSHRDFVVRAAWPKDQSAKADRIELMMISGDIWQFHYDPRLPSSQPLAEAEPMAIARLARYCGVDERQMPRSMSQPDSTPVAAARARNQTPGRRYAEALRRWHDALATTGCEEPESNRDLVMFSLRASQYLADTRTAAYLWVKTYPREARQLLADGAYRDMLPTATPTPDADEWIKQLRQQAVAARSCVPAATEWLLVPVGTGCAPQASEQQRKLAALVAELAPALPDQRQGQGQ